MKRFGLHLFIALLTFLFGLTFATFFYLRPSSPGAPLEAALAPKLKAGVNESAWQELLSFENQDLRELDQKSRADLQNAIDTLAGESENGRLVPRLVSKIPGVQGQISYALVEESPLVTIPGQSGIRIHLFNSEGKLLSSAAFSTGWRISLADMKLTYVPEIGREVLVVNSKPEINGRDVAKQYYALIGEKVLLVRLEDSSGKPVRNIYGAPHHTIGPALSGRSAGEWEKVLESRDEAEVLAALTWLGGIHWNPDSPAPEYEHEELSEAYLAEGVRSSKAVKVALSRLARSENAWLRSATALAAKVEYYR
jgi:hypothetical protein